MKPSHGHELITDLYIINTKSVTIRCWVAAHMCVLSHFRTCDVRAEVRAERVWNCACGSACVWGNFQCAICDRTLLLAYVLIRCNFQSFSADLLSIIDLPAIMSRFAAAAAPQRAAARTIEPLTFYDDDIHHQLHWYISTVQFTMYYLVVACLRPYTNR